MLPNCCLLSNAPLTVGATVGKTVLLDANVRHNCAAHTADVALFSVDSFPVHIEGAAFEWNEFIQTKQFSASTRSCLLPTPEMRNPTDRGHHSLPFAVGRPEHCQLHSFCNPRCRCSCPGRLGVHFNCSEQCAVRTECEHPILLVPDLLQPIPAHEPSVRQTTMVGRSTGESFCRYAQVKVKLSWDNAPHLLAKVVSHRCGFHRLVRIAAEVQLRSR